MKTITTFAISLGIYVVGGIIINAITHNYVGKLTEQHKNENVEKTDE